MLSVRYELRLKKQLSIKHIVQLPQPDVSTQRVDIKHLVCSKNKHAVCKGEVCNTHQHLQFTAVYSSVRMAHVLTWLGMNIRIHGGILYDKQFHLRIVCIAQFLQHTVLFCHSFKLPSASLQSLYTVCQWQVCVWC